MTWFRRPDPESWGHPEALPRPVRLNVCVMFTEPGDDRVLIDCVSLDDVYVGCEAVESGQPLSLEVAMPADGWRIAALITLDRWAAQSAVVTAELTGTPSPRVKLSDRDSVVVFDLLALINS